MDLWTQLPDSEQGADVEDASSTPNGALRANCRLLMNFQLTYTYE